MLDDLYTVYVEVLVEKTAAIACWAPQPVPESASAWRFRKFS
jgi:hypothetical protein